MASGARRAGGRAQVNEFVNIAEFFSTQGRSDRRQPQMYGRRLGVRAVGTQKKAQLIAAALPAAHAARKRRSVPTVRATLAKPRWSIGCGRLPQCCPS